MSSTRGNQRDEFVPLSERVSMLMGFRVVAAVTVALMNTTLLARTDVAGQWLLAGSYLAISALLSLPVLSSRRKLTLRTFGFGLLVDGVFLQGEQAWGAAVDGLVIVVVADLVVVCLLASFRTGLRVALWHSLLVFILHQAAALHSLHGLPSRLADQGAMLAYLAGIWLTVLATAAFAAVNERELRRRRYDAEALRRFASDLVRTELNSDVRAALLDFCRIELGAHRCAWIASGAHGYSVAVARGVIAADAEPYLIEESELLEPHGSVARIVDRFGVSDQWLAKLFPDARRLIGLPIPGAQETDWLVLEHRGRGTRLERRVISSGMQACSAAALGYSRTTVLGELRAAAATDPLTGCANRRCFDEELQRLSRSGRSLPVSLVLVDIDHFKAVNDEHGHQVGDDVLRSVTEVLQLTARSSDLVARYGGEEFAIVMPGTLLTDAREIGERMRLRVQAGSGPINVTVSIGVAATARSSIDIPDLISRADEALYLAKHLGRNRVVVDGGLIRDPTEQPWASLGSVEASGS